MEKNCPNEHYSIEWDDRFELGIPLIDSQHRNLVRITDNLYFACRKNSESASCRFIQAARELIDYIDYHFNTEEKLMLLLEFPERLNHKKEHEDFLQEIISRSSQINDENPIVPNNFLRFLKEGILMHITVSDKVFTDFFQNQRHHDKLKLVLTG